MTSTQKFIDSVHKRDNLREKLQSSRDFYGFMEYKSMADKETVIKVSDLRRELEEKIKKYAANYPNYCEHLIKTHEYILNRRKKR